MTMESNNLVKQIDFVKIFKAAVKRKRLFIYSLPTAFALACFFILCIPRYYTCTVKLAPEMSSLNASSLNDIASSFGFDLGGASSSNDAIFPEMYPELMESVTFRTGLFPIDIHTADGKISTTYYDYLANKQKAPWWGVVKSKISHLFAEKQPAGNGKVDPFRMTKRQKDICDLIGDKIVCDVDKKNSVISITVTDQDALVCATMADSVRTRLQAFITEYRTNKAKTDYEYTKGLYAEAKKDYEKARRIYAAYADANTDLTLTSFKSKVDDLENEMQLKFNTYSSVSMQLQAARARVQERTPAFTTLQAASVPIKPAGPKRMIFVAVITLITFVATTIYAAYKEDCI